MRNNIFRSPIFVIFDRRGAHPHLRLLASARCIHWFHYLLGSDRDVNLPAVRNEGHGRRMDRVRCVLHLLPLYSVRSSTLCLFPSLPLPFFLFSTVLPLFFSFSPVPPPCSRFSPSLSL